MAAARAVLDEVHDSLPQPKSDSNAYMFGSIGGHNVVVSCPPFGIYGTTSATMVMLGMLSTFPSIRYGLMVGIGGGAPSKRADIRLGDVVVSKPTATSGGVIQYDFGKTARDGHFQRIGVLNKPPSVLLTALAKAESTYMTETRPINKIISDALGKSQTITEQFSRPNEDWLFHATYDHHQGGTECSACDKSQLVNRVPRTTDEPHIHYGLIASANQLMKDAQARDRLAQEFDILCFEMECAGLMDHFPCLVIRGICDYSDSHKHKRWQGYAALTAAAYGKLLLSVIVAAPVKFYESKIAVNESETVAKVADWILQENINAAQYDLLNRSQLGTGLWFLESEEYQKWITGHDQTVFWQAMPGVGKTILSAILAEDLRRKFNENNLVGVAALFCDYQKRNEQGLLYFLSSILKQLVQYRRHLPEAVKVLYEFHCTRKTRPSYDDLSNALQSMIEDLSETFIIIDGLDECVRSDGTLKSLLFEIFRLQKQGHVCLFATSRPIPDIVKEFKTATKLDARATDDDLRTFIGSYTRHFQSFLENDPILQNKIKDDVTDAANGMFLFAKLHMDSIISKPTRKHVEAALNNLTTASEVFQPFYEQSINRIMDQIPESRVLALRTLSWIAYSRDSLSVSELQHALGVEDARPGIDKHGIPEIENIISVCYGLVLFDEVRNTVSFSHQTVRACLKQNKRFWLPLAERDIAITCIIYLSYKIFEDGPCTSHDAFNLRLQSYPLLRYAAHNWGHHAVACRLEEEDLILTFLSNRARLAAAFQVILVSKSGFDSSEIISKQITGLHIAAYFGMQRTIAFLLDHGHPPAPTDSYGQTPLWWAAKERHMEVMMVLSRRDTVTLQMLIQQGDWYLVRLLLVAGYDVNTKGFWNRSPLHEAILARNIILTRELISAGADTDSRDSDDFTPLQLAVRRADREFIELLLKNLAKENGIMSNEWRHAFKMDSSHFVQIRESKDLGKSITFQRDKNISWREHNHDSPPKPRSLSILTDGTTPLMGSIPVFGPVDQVQLFKIYTQSIRDCDRCFRYSIMVCLPERKSLKQYCATRDVIVGIAWTVTWLIEPDSHHAWKSIEHFSTLPYGWTPKNGIEFIQQFISIVEKRWIQLCNAGLRELNEQRRKILHAKGNDPSILDNLLADAQTWTEFRNCLQTEADDIIDFTHEYNRRHHDVSSENIQGMIQFLLNRVGERISELDETSKGLIQTEFNLVSINEAHRSTSTAKSMKRLSWITFVFLPATFASSLFGMNVNLLQDSPDWRWYILFVAVLLLLTLSGWLIFKYNPIEYWIEQKAIGILHKLNRRNVRHDVERSVR